MNFQFLMPIRRVRRVCEPAPFFPVRAKRARNRQGWDSACQGAGKRRAGLCHERRDGGIGNRPPPNRRDLQRRSFPRIDPATRHSPTWPLERTEARRDRRSLRNAMSSSTGALSIGFQPSSRGGPTQSRASRHPHRPIIPAQDGRTEHERRGKKEEGPTDHGVIAASNEGTDLAAPAPSAHLEPGPMPDGCRVDPTGHRKSCMRCATRIRVDQSRQKSRQHVRVSQPSPSRLL